MTRNLKVLGLALVAVFAMSVVSASAASASVFTSGGHNVELRAESLSAQVFSAGELEVNCENIAVDNTVVGTEQSEITSTPTYPVVNENDCVALGFPAKIDMNECHYLFTASGSVHILCPAEKQIEITAKILGSYRKCIDVHAQTPTNPSVTYTNNALGTPEMDVKLTSNVTGITYEKTGLCGSGEFNNAGYSGSATITGWEGGKQVDVTWDE